MTHVIEEAKSGRSKCRGCGSSIAKGELRFGERLPNPFADDGDMTLWFHIVCGAMRRPASFGEMLDHELIEQGEALGALVAAGVEHYRLERIAGVEKAASGRAKCRHCRESIEKDAWRIPLVFFEEGMFNSSGFIHVSCAKDYFGTSGILDRLKHFRSKGGGNDATLSDDDVESLAELLSD